MTRDEAMAFLRGYRGLDAYARISVDMHEYMELDLTRLGRVLVQTGLTLSDLETAAHKASLV
jgi:hypothetical protein